MYVWSRRNVEGCLRLQWQIEKDMRELCFVCGKSASEFQHVGRDFERHVKREHNQWSYVYLLIHLDDTPRNDLSSLEMAVLK